MRALYSCHKNDQVSVAVILQTFVRKVLGST